MKNSIFIFILVSLVSCKKDAKNDKQSLDTATLNEMIQNYSTPTGGDINLEYQSSFNWDGSIFESSTASAQFYTIDTIHGTHWYRTNKLIIENKELLPTTPQYSYGITNTNECNAFIRSIFGNKIISLKLYDTTNVVISEFNFKTPTSIIMQVSMKDELHSVTKATWEKEKITWNADVTNKIGVVLEYQGDNPFNHGVVFLADDGEESIKNVVGDLTGNISLRIYRGAILIKTGADGRKYRVICVSKSSNYIYLH